MPVGGIKEKVLAAHRAGIKKIILPRRNQIDLEELPEEVLKSTKFVFADTVDDVLKSALLKTKVSRIKMKMTKESE
jgi:ATP-dependent Lon protease